MNLFITADQAIEFLPEGNSIHTFKNPSGILIGCDISRKGIIERLNGAKTIEIAGDGAKALKHAIAVIDDTGLLFIESDMDKINKYESEQVR